MQRIIVPFALSEGYNVPAVSEHTFSIQAPQSNFNRVSVRNIKFMKHYEQSKYKRFQRPGNQSWDEYWLNLQSVRQSIASGSVEPRNDIIFGHSRQPEIAALDELPEIIEIEIVRSSLRSDRVNILAPSQPDYQSVNPDKKRLVEDNKTLQSVLVYNSNLRRSKGNLGYEGSIACNMSNVGSVSVRDQGHGNTFTVKVKMYNAMGQAMDSIPRMEINLFFS